MSQDAENPPIDPVTVAAIGVVAYLLANVLHEGAGHGGACVLIGCKPIALSSAYFDGDHTGIAPWLVRFEKAGGTLANLVTGALTLVALPSLRRRAPTTWFFAAWLFCMVSLLQGGGYMMVSPLAGFGDWDAFCKGLEQPLVWRVGLTLLGVGISWGALRAGVTALEPLLGPEEAVRQRRARVLCLVPYIFAGGAVFIVAAALNPLGFTYVITSAAAHLGGTAWLAWLPEWIKGPKGTAERPRGIPRSIPWIVAGTIAAAVCILVLGPSIQFSR